MDGELAWLHGSSLNETTRASGDGQWAIVGARAAAAYRLSAAWALRGELGAGIGIGAPDFVSAGPASGHIQDVYHPDPVARRAALGLELSF
jgi:hypothetical protein